MAKQMREETVFSRDARERIKYREKDGLSVGNPKKGNPSLGYKKQPTLAERMRDMIRSEKLREIAEMQGRETFDEADDFDVGDDYDPSSPYEEVFEGDPLTDNYERLENAKTAPKERSDPKDRKPTTPSETKQPNPISEDQLHKITESIINALRPSPDAK